MRLTRSPFLPVADKFRLFRNDLSVGTVKRSIYGDHRGMGAREHPRVGGRRKAGRGKGRRFLFSSHLL